MNKLLCAFLPLFCLVSSASAAADNLSPHRQTTYLGQHLSFEPNVGEADPSASFISSGPAHLVELAPDQVTFHIAAKSSVQMNFLRANKSVQLQGDSLLPGKANYFSGRDASRWHANIPTYERVTERAIYPGVDLAFYGNPDRFEYDFAVQPNASIDSIQLMFSGSDHASITSQGDLLLQSGSDEVKLLKPVAYQLGQDGKTRESVDAMYRLDQQTGLVRFAVGSYDHSRSLTIDPVLSYSEYLNFVVNAATSDNAGNIYVVSGSQYTEGTITKLSPSGTVLYTTTFGTDSVPSAVAVDSTGRAYIAGQAGYASGLPVNSNSYSSTLPQLTAAFFAQVSADGASIPYATFLGGATDYSYNQPSGIAIDAADNAYLVGGTNSASFPTTPGAYESTIGQPNQDAGFIAKFNPNLSGKASLIYSTLMAVTTTYGATLLSSIAVDRSGSAYVTGWSTAPDYPVTSGAYQYTGYRNNQGVYVTKLNATGTGLVYSSLLGDGYGSAIAVDAAGNAYVTGTVGYAGFPVTPGAYQTTYPGGFVTELNASGTAQVYSTFLGGPESAQTGGVTPTSIALTPGCPATSPVVIVCDAYITGYTGSGFPAINSLQSALASFDSAFIVELSSVGQSALLSTFLGGASPYSYGGPGPFVSVDLKGNIDLAGNLTTSGPPFGFPVTVPSTNAVNPAFVARIAPVAAGELVATPLSAAFINPVGVSSTVLGTTTRMTLANLGSSAVAISSIGVSPSTFSQANTCGTSLAAGSSCGLTVDFSPSSATTTAGTISVNSSALNSTFKIPLNGTGYNSSYLHASVSSLNFPGSTAIGSSVSQTVVITNLGDVTATPVFSVPSTDFAITSGCSGKLASHENCTITVTFTPTQVGLREFDLTIQDSTTYEESLVLTGTGKVPGVNPVVDLYPASLQFAGQLVGTSGINGQGQNVNIYNTSAEPITTVSATATGDFQVQSNTCDGFIGELLPFDTCSITVIFSPSAVGTRTGLLTVVTSASTTPQTIPLTGIGVASSQKLEIYPSSYIMTANQPVGTAGPYQTITLENTGVAPIEIYRVTITGPFQVDLDDCSSSSIAGTTDDGGGSYSFCQLSVAFAPKTTGSQSGTLMIYDSAPGSPHVVSLSGTGIADTGTVTLSETSLTFPPLPVGTSTSESGLSTGALEVTLYNPGDSPVTVSAINVSGDFNEYPENCEAPPFTIFPGQPGCSLILNFSPSAIGTRTGTLTIQGSAGTQTAALTGTGVASTQSVRLVPSGSLTFGSQGVLQSGDYATLLVLNTGTNFVTFTNCSVTGANASDFTVSSNNACPGSYGPGSICTISIQFAPSATGQRSAVLTLTGSAGTQKVNLTGTGLAATPAYTVSPQFQTFLPQAQGVISVSPGNVYFTNTTSSSVSLGNVAVTGNFILQHGTDVCSGATLSAGGSCYLLVDYVPPIANPPANRFDNGKLTIPNSTGTVLATVLLAGYSTVPVYSANVTQSVVNFEQQQGLGTTGSYEWFALGNTGSAPLTVGTLSGTNLGVAGSGAEFSLAGDGCSNVTLPAGSYCNLSVTFTPNVVGASTGTINFPVTYANKTSATLTTKLNATGIAASDQVLLSPLSIAFPDLGVGTSESSSAILSNTGNQPVSVGLLTGVNTSVGASSSGEFSTKISPSDYDGCSNTVIYPGSSCGVTVSLTPAASGTRSGSITFPLTFLDKHTSSVVLALSGNALAASRTLQISPLMLKFPAAVENQQNVTVEQFLSVTNTGDAPITIGKDLISTNSANFQLASDGCSSTVLAAGAGCGIYVLFQPGSTSIGTITGVLSIADNAAGGPHKVALSGEAITASQQVEASQSTVNFGTTAAGTTSNPQVIYISDQGQEEFNIVNVTLTGPNASDFQMGSGCFAGEYISSASSCEISVIFAPALGETGTRTATITESDSSPGSPHIITVTGTAK